MPRCLSLLLILLLTACGGSSSPSSSLPPADTTAPVLTLSGDDPQTIEAGEAYTEMGATATDNVDGDVSGAISIDTGSLDTRVPGAYGVTYSVSDSAGNRTTVTRTVVIQDTTPPVITLIGDDPQVIMTGTPYTELGAIASDSLDGDLSASIIIDASGVDTSSSGNYQVTYDVQDASGNTATTVTRTVTVEGLPLSNDSELTSLMLAGVELDQFFQSSLTDYTATVRLLRSTTTVTATLSDPNATMTVNGTTVGTGVASGKITLDHGNNVIAVAITAEDGATITTYTINVTRETVASFAQRAYIKASNTDGADFFGSSVALSGDTLAVGAPAEDSATAGIDGDQAGNSADSAGAVYVFTRDPAGLWSQQAYVKASNTDAGDRFGSSVALSGDTLVVGAAGEDSGATGIDGNQADDSAPDSGAVYVFKRDPAGVWSQQAYVKASNAESSTESNGTSAESFGISVALSGDMLAVGATGEDSAANGIDGDQSDNSANGAGAVYIFARDPAGVWSQQAYVKASNTDAGDVFGYSVALSGDTLAVGARGEDSAATAIDGDQGDNNAPISGAVYVFTRGAAGAWSQQAYVKASNTDASDGFGHSVALSGNTLAVGAAGEISGATGIDGDQSDNSGENPGAVYVFARDPAGVWSQQAYIKASNADVDGDFDEVALSGDTLAVGSGGDSSVDLWNGAVYLYTRNAAGVWAQQAYVRASNAGSMDFFGASVALSGDTLAVGAPEEDSAATGIDGDQSSFSASLSGAVYVFE